MKVIVTGGSGFIGRYLCEYLVGMGCDVINIDNKPGYQMNTHQLNIVDLPGLYDIFQTEQPEMVFHMAANSNIRAGLADSDVDLSDTFLTTYRVLQVMRKLHVKKILFASTSAVYGEVSGLLLENIDIPDPISYYGAAKLASEGFIRAFVALNNMQAWICRFSNIVGKGMTHGIIFDLLNKLKNNPEELEVLGNGEQTKPYLHVQDLIGAMFCIMTKSDKPYNLYNIGPTTTTKVKDVVRILLEETRLTPVIHYTGEDRGWPGDVPNFQYNTARLTRLGWKATLTSDEAVRLAIRESL